MQKEWPYPIKKGWRQKGRTKWSYPVTKGRRQKGGHTLSPKYSNSSFPEVLGGGGRLGSRSENVKIKIDIFKKDHFHQFHHHEYKYSWIFLLGVLITKRMGHKRKEPFTRDHYVALLLLISDDRNPHHHDHWKETHWKLECSPWWCPSRSYSHNSTSPRHAGQKNSKSIGSYR